MQNTDEKRELDEGPVDVDLGNVISSRAEPNQARRGQRDAQPRAIGNPSSALNFQGAADHDAETQSTGEEISISTEGSSLISVTNFGQNSQNAHIRIPNDAIENIQAVVRENLTAATESQDAIDRNVQRSAEA